MESSKKSSEHQSEEKYDSVSEEETLVSEFEEEEDDIANKEDYVKTEEKRDVLCIGMEFSSDETAHKAYKKFAGEHGFNKTGKYKIMSFSQDHNHDLVKTPMKHLMKGNRTFSLAQTQHADDAEMSGISAKATVEMMSREVGGRENLGVNHHKQTVVFGAALLYDETIESYRWLFETFLGAMSGKQPKTILTDQSAAMANAIVKVFPETKHRLCVWHIYQNAAKKLSHVFHGSGQFATDFGKCVYDHEEEEDWLLAWSNMLKKHNLIENKWLKNVFEVKEKWAMVYGRHTFTADMVSTQSSESMNNILKRYLKSSYDLLSFFEHYERVLDDRRYNELTADFKMMHTSSVLSATVEMLQHAEEVYTPEVFKLFQKQYTAIGDYVAKKVSKSEMVYEYKVSYRGGPREHLVNYDAENQTIQCSCMKYIFAGILCRHALKVLDKKDVRRIPSSYILNRWSREAKSRSISSYRSEISNGTVTQSIGKRYSHLCRNFREIASLAAEHVELTMCANEAASQLLKKLEEKKKELVKANAWMLPTSNVEHGEREEEDEVLNARGIKRKATVGRPKNKPVGPHGRYLNDSTFASDIQLSVASENPTLQTRTFSSQVHQDSTFASDIQLSVASENSTLQTRPFSSQVHQDSTFASDIQLSVASENSTLQTRPFSSQVHQDSTFASDIQLSVASENPTLQTRSFFSQVQQDSTFASDIQLSVTT
ncbi:Zinc finger PMZ-type, partial [Arabidopsis suecica]